jgi:hypothetical protein
MSCSVREQCGIGMRCPIARGIRGKGHSRKCRVHGNMFGPGTHVFPPPRWMRGIERRTSCGSGLFQRKCLNMRVVLRAFAAGRDRGHCSALCSEQGGAGKDRGRGPPATDQADSSSVPMSNSPMRIDGPIIHHRVRDRVVRDPRPRWELARCKRCIASGLMESRARSDFAACPSSTGQSRWRGRTPTQGDANGRASNVQIAAGVSAHIEIPMSLRGAGIPHVVG